MVLLGSWQGEQLNGGMRPKTIPHICGDFENDHGGFGLEDVQDIDVHVELQILYESLHQRDAEVPALLDVH